MFKILLGLFLLLQAASVNKVVSVSPSEGKAGTPMTITGEGFRRDASVRFGGITATSIVVKPDKITCKAPVQFGVSGKVDIAIVSPAYPPTVLSNAFEYK
jgi:hypothetical protein